MKGMELPLAACARNKRALVCARCLLGVEKVGSDWVKQNGEVKEVKEVKDVEEVEEVRGRAVAWMEEEICGFGEDNMKECTTKLARE
jgi:hypothetical protein